MSKLPYWTCPDCGSNLPHGERCDCGEEAAEERLRKEKLRKHYYPERERDICGNYL